MSNEKQLSEKGEGMVVCEHGLANWRECQICNACLCEGGKAQPYCARCLPPSASPALVEGERQELLGKEGAGRGDIEPHLRTEEEVRDLFPRFEALSDRLCQTQGKILWALKEAGLTVVRLDPSAREVAPDGASPPSEPRAAPPISIEEQAQPDAQDLTEEEIDRLEWAVKHAVQPSVIELVPRLIANEKRRRGIK